CQRHRGCSCPYGPNKREGRIIPQSRVIVGVNPDQPYGPGYLSLSRQDYLAFLAIRLGYLVKIPVRGYAYRVDIVLCSSYADRLCASLLEQERGTSRILSKSTRQYCSRGNRYALRNNLCLNRYRPTCFSAYRNPLQATAYSL